MTMLAHAERRHQRVDADTGDEEAVQPADQQPDAEAGGDSPQDRHIAASGHHHRRYDADERDGETKRQVEAARQQHHGLRHGKQCEITGLDRDVPEIAA
ncbi:hypothetical protein NKK48_00625 [Mesorhizobium sp. C386A]